MSNYGQNDPNQPYDPNNSGGNDPYGQQGQQGQQPQYGQQGQPYGQPQYGDQYGQQGSEGYGAAPGYSPMPGGGGPVGTPPPNNLALAIISTVLCCLPLGIYAIIQATKVNSLWQQGDVAGAQDASEKAKKFSIYAIVIGFVVGIISLILQVAVLNSTNS